MTRVVRQHHSREFTTSRAHIRRAMTFIELMVVLGVLALFAMVVIPGVAGARVPLAQPIQEMLEADLRRARTESLARAEAVVMVAAENGSGWWLALASSPQSELTGTKRSFGHGVLSEFTTTSLHVRNFIDEGDNVIDEEQIDAHVVAQFDALGTRDDRIKELTLSAEKANIAQWTLCAGRTRLVAR